MLPLGRDGVGGSGSALFLFREREFKEPGGAENMGFSERGRGCGVALGKKTKRTERKRGTQTNKNIDPKRNDLFSNKQTKNRQTALLCAKVLAPK